MIAVVMTAEPTRVAWLPHFVRHYVRQGASHFELSVQFEPNTTSSHRKTVMRNVDAMLKSFADIRLRELVCGFDAMALRAHHDEIQREISRYYEWIVWADVDEFQVYPYSLPDITAYWKKRGQNACKGFFVDRITRDGSLRPFDSKHPIWAQFPVGANVTKVLVQGQTNKVVCARSDVRIKYANHDPLKGQEIAWAEIYVPVHHFKWDASLRNRLAIRLTDAWKRRCPWWPQTERLFAALDSSGGRLPLSQLHLFDYRDDDYFSERYPFETNSRYLEALLIPSELYLNR